jgi:hypothetical protein
MNKQQRIAIKHHCRLAVEAVNPRFNCAHSAYSVQVTVNSGWE